MTPPPDTDTPRADDPDTAMAERMEALRGALARAERARFDGDTLWELRDAAFAAGWHYSPATWAVRTLAAYDARPGNHDAGGGS